MTTWSAVDSGYVIEALYFPVQQLTPAEAGAERGEISRGWDWRWNDHDHFEVGLLFGAPAGNSRPERMEVAATASSAWSVKTKPFPCPRSRMRTPQRCYFRIYGRWSTNSRGAVHSIAYSCLL